MSGIGVGPIFGQVGYFVKFGGRAIEDSRPRDRFIGEARRLLGVLNMHLEGRDWVSGDFSIADIAIAPWLNGLAFYEAHDLVGWSEFSNLQPYVDRFYARPAVARGQEIPARD